MQNAQIDKPINGAAIAENIAPEYHQSYGRSFVLFFNRFGFMKG